jgi:hypothetical protein
MALLDRVAKAGTPVSQEMVPIPGSQLDTLPKATMLGETGVSGLLRTRGVGYVYEEWLAALSTHRAKQVYREMRDNDAVIGAMFFALEMILRKAEWRIEPAKGKKGDDYAEFLKQCMEDMAHSWEDFVAECVSMFAFGFALFETVYKRRQGANGRKASKYDDGLIGWRKLAPRAQESILYWIWDDEGGLQGAVQLAAPDYKTVPIPIERLLLFRTTSLKNNPEGRSVLRNCYRCFDDQTEILTQAGWRRGVDLEGTESVAVLSPDGKLQYEHPSAFPRYEYEGDLLHFESKYLNQAVTPNHELWACRYGTKDYQRILAEDVSLRMQVKRDAAWDGVERQTFVIPSVEQRSGDRCGGSHARMLPPIEIPMENWLRFLGIWLAEGGCSLEGRNACISIHQKLGEKADKIYSWLQRLPFHVYKHLDGDDRVAFEITNKQLWNVVSPMGKTLFKSIPQYVKELSPRQIRTFLSAFHLGDGGGGTVWRGRTLSKVYFTASDQLADDLCELILKAGMAPTKRRISIPEWKPEGWVPRTETSSAEYQPGVRAHEVWAVSEGKHKDCRIKRIYRDHYKGTVWCVSTQSGLVYVRRKGKCQWSGNSWFFKRRIEEVEGIGIERDLCGIPVLYASAETIATLGGGNPDLGMQRAKQLVTNIRIDDQAGIILPLSYDENKNPMVKLELLHSGGPKQTKAGESIKRYNEDILNTMLTGFIQFGQTPRGTRSMHMSATQIFSLAISAFMDSVAAVINRIAVPRLLALNSMDLEYAPKLQAGEIGVRDLQELGQYIGALSQSGLTFFDKPTSDYLRKTGGLPATPEEAEVGGPPPDIPDPSARYEQAGGGMSARYETSGAGRAGSRELETPPEPGRPGAAAAPASERQGRQQLEDAL